MNIAISIGDLNGIGIQLALIAHDEIKKLCNPIYTIDNKMLKQASKLLNIEIPKDFKTIEVGNIFKLSPSIATKESGKYSFDSFLKAILMAEQKEVDAIVTLPINKEAWSKANIKYKGHTDFLQHYFRTNTIMMIGCEELFTALYTHHIPLKDVPSKIKKEPLTKFMIDLYNQIKENKIAVLGLNPHAGDGGVIGDEEEIIKEAIKSANKYINKNIFTGPLVPDTAFTKDSLKRYKYFVAMYHDQGLIAVKSLYFESSINVTLNTPIIRTSVDHGTAYDIAYKDKKPSTLSYVNAIQEAIKLANKTIH